MSKKILFSLLLLVLIVSFSCSKNEDTKKLSTTEITSFLLVNEQLPIKTLSNALEWPEEVILGLDLGLIKLNEDGEERLKDIFEDYLEDGKDNFIKDNNEKDWNEFVKGDWIKSETTKIYRSKLNEIKKHEFTNNEIIQNKLNNYVSYYVERQTEELSSDQFSFFSKGFWKNIGQISLMQIKSIFWGKISNWNLQHIDAEYKIELQKKWTGIYKSYFKINHIENDINDITLKYHNFVTLKHNYLAKISKIKNNNNKFVFFKPFIIKQKENIKIDPIINSFNLELISNLGTWILEILLGIIIFGFIKYLFINIIYSEEIKSYNETNNLFLNILTTPTSPLVGGLSILGLLGNELFNGGTIKKINNQRKSITKNLKTFFGIILFAFSIWYFPKKQIIFESIIRTNLENNFKTQFNKDSFAIIDNLNLTTELFFTSI